MTVKGTWKSYIGLFANKVYSSNTDLGKAELYGYTNKLYKLFSVYYEQGTT